MCRAMKVDVEWVRRKDGRLGQLTAGQRRRCDGLDTRVRDRGGLSLDGWLTLGVGVNQEEVTVAAAVVAAVTVVAAVVEGVRAAAFAWDLMILLGLNCYGNAFG